MLFKRVLFIDSVLFSRCSSNAFGQLHHLRSFLWKRPFSDKKDATLGELFGPIKRAPKAELRKRKYDAALSRLIERFDARFGRWKIFRAFYDRPERNTNLRLLYKENSISRAQLSRGIWTGYATVLVIAVGLIWDIRGFRKECFSSPIVYSVCGVVSVSFATYISLRSRSYVSEIHAIAPKIVPTKRTPSYSSGKYTPSTYVLTSAHPVSGLERRVQFGLSDVRVLDTKTMESWPWWRRLIYFLDPAKGNVLIHGRPFMVDSKAFSDDAFYMALLYPEPERTPRRA